MGADSIYGKGLCTSGDSLNESDVRMILNLYENSYLYLDEVPDLKNKKKALLEKRDRSVEAINSWFRSNVPWDNHTRIHKEVPRTTNVTLEFPMEATVIVKLRRIDRDTSNTVLVNLKELQPEVLILDLRDSTGNDDDAALSLTGALVEGEICTQRYAAFDRVTISRRASLHPHIIFIFTNEDTSGCARMIATSLYLNSEKVTVIGTAIDKDTVGLENVRRMKGHHGLVFSMASYRWSVNGKGPDIFSEPGLDRFIDCGTMDEREMMSIVYDRIVKWV